MQNYIEATELLEEYIEEYKKLLENQQLNKFNAPLILQYRSDIQDIIDFFYNNQENVPFSLYQDFQKLIEHIGEFDQKLVDIMPEIKRLININHYKNKYPQDHWWWYS